jgi:NAD(P)-dependent dehydrogenase (short-subunit alcohol dehydrogenase family)
VTAVADLLDLGGRVAVVTGASGGIGSAIARRLTDAGAAVVAQYRTDGDGVEQLRAGVAAAGGRIRTVRGDLRIPDDLDAIFADAERAFGRVDILINSAGAFRPHDLGGDDAAGFRDDLDDNLLSAVECTRRVVPRMRQRGGGSIVNIASLSALHPAPGQAGYVTAKAALIAFTRSAAQEFGPSGIRVNAVSPGLIWRPTLHDDWPEGERSFAERAPLRRVGMPDDVADACLFLAAPASSWITGQNLVVDGGISATGIY